MDGCCRPKPRPSEIPSAAYEGKAFVLADAGTEPGVTFVDLDLARVEEARHRVPSLSHDRDFDGP